jgi:NhaP-type Na+/H+ or K+/H+ antiporter
MDLMDIVLFIVSGLALGVVIGYVSARVSEWIDQD